jgi:hypothetical protein
VLSLSFSIALKKNTPSLTCFLQSTPLNGISVHVLGTGAGLGAARAGEAASRRRRESATAAAAKSVALFLLGAAMVDEIRDRRIRPFPALSSPFYPRRRRKLSVRSDEM